jgi:hypothetical protein
MLNASTLQSLISHNTKEIKFVEEDIKIFIAHIEKAGKKEGIYFNTKRWVKPDKNKLVKLVTLQKKLRKELKHIYWYAAWAKDAQGYNNPQKELLSSYGVLESFQTVKECLAMDEVEAHWHGRVL